MHDAPGRTPVCKTPRSDARMHDARIHDAPGKTPARGVSTLMNTPHFAKSGNRAARQNVETPLAGVSPRTSVIVPASDCGRLAGASPGAPLRLRPSVIVPASDCARLSAPASDCARLTGIWALSMTFSLAESPITPIAA